MCNQRNPVAAACDKIEHHVADRERDLIERLAAALSDLREVVPQHTLPWVRAAKANADAVLAEADAWLAEPVEITVHPEYGEIDPAVEAIITEVRRALWTLPAFANLSAESIGRIVDDAVEQTRKELESDVN